MKFRLPETLPLKAPLRQTRTELDRCGEIKYTFIHYVMRQMTWHVRTGWKRGGGGGRKKRVRREARGFHLRFHGYLGVGWVPESLSTTGKSHS